MKKATKHEFTKLLNILNDNGSQSMTVQNIISIFGIISGLSVFVLALRKYQESLKQREVAQRQYQEAQNWKRLEFVAKEMRVFMDNSEVQNAITMMSWYGKKIEFFPRSTIEDRHIYRTVDMSEITSAFAKLNDNNGLTEGEAAIVETFDIFFQEVERLSSFVSSKLIQIDDLIPYIDSWLFILLKPKEYARSALPEKKIVLYCEGIETIQAYIKKEEYQGATRLLEGYKKHLSNQNH